jgi:predicted kinase
VKKPGLVVVSGPPCSGKSTLARALAAAAELVRLEMDEFRVRLLPASTQAEADRDLAYRAMHLSAELLVRAGLCPALDATYARAASRTGLESVSRATAAGIYLIECRVDPAIAVSRFEARGSSHPAVDLTPARVERLAIDYPYCGCGLTVSSDDGGPLDIPEILNYLAEGIPLTCDAGWSAAAEAKHDACSSLSRSQSRPGGSSTSS